MITAKAFKVRRWVVTGLVAILAAGCSSGPPRPSPEPTPLEKTQATTVTEFTAETEATTVTEFTVELASGESVTFESAGAGPDPVLHLVDRRGRQVAIAYGTRLTYRAPVKDTYWLVVRARSNTSAGTADILRNGASWRTGVRFAGTDLLLGDLRRSELLETVRLPGGAAPTHSLYVLKPDGLGIERRVVGGGVAGAARFGITTETGTRHVVLGVPARRLGPLVGPASGPVRLLRNDRALFGHDADRDGLGYELESALGTCATRTSTAPGVSCAAIADPRDTDGDGISDGLEVGIGGDDLPLPLWGADPRHKDLFVEVDFMRRTKAENDAETTLHMPPHVARSFAAYYGDALTSDSALRAQHAATLKNPDGQPGIAAHLDTGVNPESPADATIYGDWGGFNAVNAKKVGGKYSGVVAADAWPAQMSSARRGTFRYALAYGTGGGQTDLGFTASYNFNDAYNAAHETGHSLGLGHSGPKGATGDIDVNCKPNYPSIMNYAYQGSSVGFSDGRTEEAPSLNNWALPETNAVDPGATALIDRLQNVFKYWVDAEHGNVDWDRDGQFAPAGTTVRAYANYRPGGGGCEFTRYNQTRLGDAPNPGSPALARVGRRMYAFSVWNRQVRFSQTDSWLICPIPAKEGCAGATWKEGTAGQPGIGAAGVDAVTIGSSGNRVLLVAMDLDFRLWQRELTVLDGEEHWGSWWHRLPLRSALFGPTLTRTSDGTPYLAYTTPNGEYRLARRPSGQWITIPFRDAAGTTLVRPEGSRFTPALVEADLGWRPGERRLYALLAAADDRLDLWALDPVAGRWEKTDLLATRPGPVFGRPSMAYAPPSPGSSVGRLYIVYVARGSGIATMMTSYVEVTETAKRQRIGLTGPFDNVWLTGPGIDLLYEPNIRTLRALLVRSKGGLEFRPKADGIQLFRYVNYDDWPVLGRNLCRGVVNPGGLVAGPVQCE
jgi:hypothetical protein